MSTPTVVLPVTSLRLIEPLEHEVVVDVESLYDMHGQDIWSYIRSMVGQAADADDVFQQVFLKAHQHVERFQGGPGKARSWLFTIAINTVRDHHRRQRDQAPIHAVSERLDHQPGAHASLVADELGERLAQAVSALSPKLREVWVMRAERDLSFKEIGGVLGEPVKRVMGRMYLAQKQLREVVDER